MKNRFLKHSPFIALFLSILFTQYIEASCTGELSSVDGSGKKGKKSGRLFAPISMENFQDIVRAAIEKKGDELENPMTLTAAIAKDLSKINSEFENFDAGGVIPSDSSNGIKTGFRMLPNKMPYWGLTGGSDSSAPIFFIIYWDGEKLRAYIPSDGNPWNTKTKALYGESEEEEDFSDLQKRYPETVGKMKTVEDYWNNGNIIRIEEDKIMADIQARILPKK